MKRKRVSNRGRRGAKQLEMSRKRHSFEGDGFSLVKNKKRNSNVLSVFGFFGVFVVVISLILIFMNAPTGFVEWVKIKSANLKADGSFPIKYDASTAKFMDYENGLISVLTDHDFKGYTNSGEEIFTRMSGFANPVVKTSKMRTLIYDLQANQYKIHTAAEELYSAQVDSSIICGDISNSGVYALAYQGRNDVALVRVFNKHNKPIYEYHSSGNYVSSVSVSEDGKRLAVAVFGANKAEFDSRVLLFSVDSEKPYSEFDFSGELIYLTEFSNNKKCLVLTDKSYSLVEGEDNVKRIDYDGKKLAKFDVDSNKHTVLLLSHDENAANKTAVVVNNKGEKVKSFKIDFEVHDLSILGNRIVFLSDMVYDYSLNKGFDKKYEVVQGATNVEIIGTKIAVLYAFGIEICNE